MDLTLPLADPVGALFVLFFVLFAAPIAAESLRAPGMVGVILAGMLLGPKGLGVLGTGALLETLGTIGLLYIFFTAGLEIDIRQLRKKKGAAAVFGSLTFLIPLALGYAVGTTVFGMGTIPALLFGSLFSSHTLLSFPIAQAMGLGNSRAVFASVGATVITDVLAMAVLALTTAGDGTGWGFWLRTVGLFAAWTAAAALVLPPLIRRFFRKIKAGGSAEFLFALAVAFFCAASAGLAGLEPAVGAFAAGLVLNRHIPERSALMIQLRFAGDSIFIPLCVFYIGMLTDIPLLLAPGRSALLAPAMLLVILASKYASSLLLKPFFGFSLAEVNISFGLSVNQAASTLAVGLVGYKLGLFGEPVLAGTAVMFVVTCVLGPQVTRRAAARLALEDSRGPESLEGRAERILIAVSNPGTLKSLADFAFLLRDPKSEEPVIPVSIVQDSPGAQKDLEQAETVLAKAIAQGVAVGVPVKPAARVSLNAAEGILEAAQEYGATTVLLGWNRPPRPSGAVFGEVIDQIIAGGREMTIVARLLRPIQEATALVLVVPPFVERNPSCVRAYSLMRRVLGGVSAKLTVLTLASDSHGVRESLWRIRGSVPHVTELSTWKEFPGAIEKFPAGAAFVFLCPRPGRLAWHPALEQLPREASAAFPDSTLFLVYLPEEAPAEDAAAEAGIPAAPEPAPAAAGQAAPPAAESRAVPEPADPSDQFYRGLVEAGRVLPNLSSAAVVDAVRDLLELGFPGDRKTVNRLAGIYSEIAQKQPIELEPGVLLLHAHVDDIPEPMVLVGAKPSGLRLLVLEEPVRIIVLMCAPSSQSPENHLRVLSLVAKSMKDKNRIERILEARTPEDLKE